MRRYLLTACLCASTLTGCASRPPEFVPAGADREALTAAIRNKGQDTSLEAGPEGHQAAPHLTRLDKGAHVVIEAAPTVLACVVMAPLVVLYALAPGHKEPLNLGNWGSSG